MRSMFEMKSKKLICLANVTRIIIMSYVFLRTKHRVTLSKPRFLDSRHRGLSVYPFLPKQMGITRDAFAYLRFYSRAITGTLTSLKRL